MTLLDIPDQYIKSESDGEIAYDFNLTVFTHLDKVRFEINGTSTSWLDLDDGFITRIQFEKLNKSLIGKHLAKEIEIKNILDKGAGHFKAQKYPKAISCFDEVIYYDDSYGEALLFKSRALFAQNHFVKALRYYKKAMKADAYLKDIEYHRLLLEKANDEREHFPKIKRQIYMGDEYFSGGDFSRAVESYDKALANPSEFKSKILYKLLNKKGCALFEMNVFDKALECFGKSLEVYKSDYAIFMKGYCEYELGMDLDDSFMGDLRITKYQQLLRALILIETGRNEDAIRCLDDLLANHFIEDKLYFMAVESRASAMGERL